jgi:hypothetical protein
MPTSQLAVSPAPTSADKTTLATFTPGGPVLLIDVYSTPSCVVAFDLYYFDSSQAAPSGAPVLAGIDADHFDGWSPPDPLGALPRKKVWIATKLLPFASAGVVERVTVAVFQPKKPNRIDDENGTYSCAIPSKPPADVMATIEVTFQSK